jgi:hypothetical protein
MHLVNTFDMPTGFYSLVFCLAIFCDRSSSNTIRLPDITDMTECKFKVITVKYTAFFCDI